MQLAHVKEPSGPIRSVYSSGRPNPMQSKWYHCLHISHSTIGLSGSLGCWPLLTMWFPSHLSEQASLSSVFLWTTNAESLHTMWYSSHFADLGTVSEPITSSKFAVSMLLLSIRSRIVGWCNAVEVYVALLESRSSTLTTSCGMKDRGTDCSNTPNTCFQERLLTPWNSWSH